MTLAKSEKNNL